MLIKHPVLPLSDQARYLLHCINKFKDPRIPLVITGDFNSVPFSSVYCHITGSKPCLREVDARWFKPCDDPEAGRRIIDIDSDSIPHLQSAYLDGAGDEPPITNFTPGFYGTLDYIFYDTRSLVCIETRELMSLEEMKSETALPNTKHGSDHLTLCATFDFTHDGMS